eukprot:GGOE01065440.1.p1 GENE.GGOE01065440.1~~GGOE01065440.1.p1  ORF type:complete len:514 (-),score=29.82 GGOE01065440.1:26-1567(-)
MFIFLCDGQKNIIFLSGRICNLEHIYETRVSDSSIPVKHLESFGFVGHPHSNFSMIIRQLSLSVLDDRSGAVGFALEVRDSKMDARHRQHRGMGDCFLAESSSHRLLAILAGNVPPSANVIRLLPQSYAASPQIIDWSAQLQPPGLYSLYFFDCSPGRRHSFDIEVHENNLKPDGTPMFLPVGDQPLPALYLTFAGAMAFGAWRWRVVMVAHRPQLKALHGIMFFVAFSTAVSWLAAAMYYSTLNHTGRVSMAVALLFHVPCGVARILTLLTVALLGLGWSLGARPLPRSQKGLLFVVGLLGSASSALWAVSTEMNEGNDQWAAARRWWRLTSELASVLAVYPLVRRVYHSLVARLAAACCYCFCPPCTALFIWMKKRTVQSEARHHCWVCVAVMGFTFLGSFGLVAESLLPYNCLWLGPAIGLFAQLALYSTLASLLHPGRMQPGAEPVSVQDDDDLLLSGDEEGWSPSRPPIQQPADCTGSDNENEANDRPMPPVSHPFVALATGIPLQHL